MKSNRNSPTTSPALVVLFLALTVAGLKARSEDVGERWGTADRERDYYRVVDVPIPEGMIVEAGAFEQLPDGRIAVGTRHGDIFFLSGIDDPKPQPRFHLFAEGLDEIFGLAWRDDGLWVTQSCELTRLQDTDQDGRADRFDAISNLWGYSNYHEYAFSSKPDPAGNIFVALGLSNSYHSRALFRGWVLKVTAEGKTIPIASGLRSPGGIGPNEDGTLFMIESQGPWNSACSLKVVREGAFLGHPASTNWYPFAEGMPPPPVQPESGQPRRQEESRIPELDPYAVVFPYIRMGRSITGFVLNRTGGRFGPFENQIFLGDYTQSLVMRATTEKVDGVWQGACYPFREGLGTGILNLQFTPEGHLLTGGTNRGWPVRGLRAFALERLDWTGKIPLEIERMHITPDGFRLRFTLPVNPAMAGKPESYRMSGFTHIYHQGYGGPEIEPVSPPVEKVILSPDHREVRLVLGEALIKGHVYGVEAAGLQTEDGVQILHPQAFYTVNAIPGS